MSVRRLLPHDARALRTLGPDLVWAGAGWGGPTGLATTGLGWGAFRGGLLLSLACPLFLGSRYEDIAVATLPQERGRGLATACVRALCADITARGRIPSWTCSRDNHPSRHLAAKSGFRPVHEYVHYAVGTRPGAPATPSDNRVNLPREEVGSRGARSSAGWTRRPERTPG
ncbi:GNAT family N-acetyltransferase [Streptomyces klenkii]|uniref:GNAT family N-acetyltransferase n=1 Tax=Streptomyces klenkii TaxID=1420899 RepID=UPI0034254743